MLKSPTIDRRTTLQWLFTLAATGSVLSQASEAKASQTHPFVFSDETSLSRILECNSPSAKRARQFLEDRCRSYVVETVNFTQSYSGCNLTRYYQELTDERRGGAEIISTLATYAYLRRISGDTYGQAQLADEALQAAKVILLSWVRSGLREGGRFRSAIVQFCDETGSNSLNAKFAIGLMLGRGTPVLVNAIDLLSALTVFSAGETKEVDQFLFELYNLIEYSSNFRANKSNLDCNRFNNHVSIQVAALASIARIRHDRKSLLEVAFGDGGQLAISWARQITNAIYGPNQRALNCFKSGESPEFWQTDTPQAGELVDRYRARPPQTFGYPMFSLTYLLLTYKILARSELRDAKPIALAQARITSALEYYGGYFANYLSSDEVKIPEDFKYPGVNQYTGKLLCRKDGVTITGRDGHILPYLLARPLLPSNDVVEAVIRRAKQFPPHHPFSSVTSLYVSDICAASG